SSSSLLIRSKNPRRCQAENPLKLLSEFAGPALLRIAAGDVSIACEPPRASSILNVFRARITASLPHGDAEVTLVLTLETGHSGVPLLARITRRSFDALRLSIGAEVFAEVARAVPLGLPSGGLQGLPHPHEHLGRLCLDARNTPARSRPSSIV
ncbi:TOBE domain-containing protein, partial [Bradyrhizobium liaoningense]